MRKGSILIALCSVVCSCAIAGAPSEAGSPKARGIVLPQPAPLFGTWYCGLGMGGGWVQLKFDHTLAVQTAGCLSREPLVTAAWVQTDNKIILTAILNPVVDPQTLPHEQLPSRAKFWAQEALFLQQERVKRLFGSGLTIFEYKTNTILVPEESLAYVRKQGYNRARCFWRDFSATGGAEWPKDAEAFDEKPVKK